MDAAMVLKYKASGRFWVLRDLVMVLLTTGESPKPPPAGWLLRHFSAPICCVHESRKRTLGDPQLLLTLWELFVLNAPMAVPESTKPPKSISQSAVYRIFPHLHCFS